MYSLVQKFASDERGATSIEYGLIAAGIGVAVITLVSEVGSELQTLFKGLRDNLQSFNNGPSMK